jgi:hypothetical protein
MFGIGIQTSRHDEREELRSPRREVAQAMAAFVTVTRNT